MTRIVLFTGKGGVGKTTVAAATAVRAAAEGRRVLITSTDPAHSLADAFDLPLGDAPRRIAERLDAQQIDGQERLERKWHQVREYLVQLLAWGGVSELQAEELVLLPGLDELFALLDLLEHATSGEYDTLVVDCAPTAETLRLLTLPDALRWYVDRILTPSRRMAKAVRPVMSRLNTVPLPDDEVFGIVEQVHGELATIHRILQDPTRSSIRLVVNAERMVVAEAMRTATSLSLFGYGVDAVVCNRLIPDAVVDPYLAAWKQRHKEHLATIEEQFAPVPVLTSPLFDEELVGVDGVALLGAAIYRDTPADAVLHVGRPLQVTATDEGYLMRLALPMAKRGEVDLHRRRDELHVKVSGVKRTLPLPAALRRCDVVGARLHDGALEVRFRRVEDSGATR